MPPPPSLFEMLFSHHSRYNVNFFKLLLQAAYKIHYNSENDERDMWYQAKFLFLEFSVDWTREKASREIKLTRDAKHNLINR